MILRSTFFAFIFLSLNITAAQAMGKGRAPQTNPKPATTPILASTPNAASTPAPAAPVPSNTPVQNSSGSLMGESCVSSDPNKICIGLKMVSFTKNGNAVLNNAQAKTLLAGINQVWSACNIGFQLEKYESVDPASRGLSYNVNWERDGDNVRNQFDEAGTFLVVSVGTLSGSTIAVTEMPGAGIYGVLVEDDYAQNFLTVGHELGHYQGLYHVDSTQNLMSAYIGPNTAALSASQCKTARNTDYANWQNMMRH